MPFEVQLTYPGGKPFQNRKGAPTKAQERHSHLAVACGGENLETFYRTMVKKTELINT